MALMYAIRRWLKTKRSKEGSEAPMEANRNHAALSYAAFLC